MKAKILVVEDDPQNMRLVGMTLKARGHILFKATNGKEALDMAIKEKPDLIIMDMQLPRLDGLEATRTFRQIPDFSRIPIIALTAYAMKGDKERFIEAGCDAYLSKPISTRELPEMIDEMLLRHNPESR